MKVHRAVSNKLNKIMIDKGLSVNKLASISCLTQSTVDSLVNGKSKILNYLLLLEFVMD